MHRHLQKQIHAHRHQLLPIQFGNIRLAFAFIRPAARALPYLLALPLRLRSRILLFAWHVRGNVGERNGLDHHRVHGRTLPGDLSSVPVAHDVEAVASGQAHSSHLAGGDLLGNTAGDAVRYYRQAGLRNVRVHEPDHGAFVRGVHAALFRAADDAHYRAVRADRAETEIIAYDEEAQQ